MGCDEREACRERDGRRREGERESNSELQTEDVHQSAVFLLCTAAPTHCEEESGRKRVPIKNGERKRRRGVGGVCEEKSGKKPCWLSLWARREAMIRL